MRLAGNKQAPQQPLSELTPRGLRSRNNLKEAARAALNELGYRKLRVQDVTQKAGVADGLFYRYFRDLREIVFEVAEDFFETMIAETAALPNAKDPFDWIFDIHTVAIRKFTANPGILACLFGLSGDYQEFDDIWKANAHDWNVHVARFLEREAGFSKQRAKRFAYVLGSMTEGVIYQSLVRKTEDLVNLGETPQEIAEIISVIWFRAIFLCDPPKRKLRPVGRRMLAAAKK